MLDPWWWATAVAVACLFAGLAFHLIARRTGVRWQRSLALVLLAIGFAYAVLFMFDLLPFKR